MGAVVLPILRRQHIFPPLPLTSPPSIGYSPAMVTRALFLQVFFCNLCFVMTAPAPQPFLEPALLPVVARTITSALPPIIVPSLGLTIPAIHLVTAFATKGLLLASLSLGAMLGKAKTAMERQRRRNWRSRRTREVAMMQSLKKIPTSSSQRNI